MKTPVLKSLRQKCCTSTNNRLPISTLSTRKNLFFRELVDFMVSGPIMVQVLEGEGAVAKNRELMGATFPRDAEPGTIRADYCDRDGDQGENAVHGSDAAETALEEIRFFFQSDEICPRTR